MWGRFGWLKNTWQWFFNHIKKYNKWWLSNTKQRILFLWHHFKSTLQHYIKDFKISSHWLWLPLNFKIALFLVQSPVARGFELHGYWVLCESRCRQNSLSHDDELKKTFSESFCSAVRFNTLTKTAQEISIPARKLHIFT